MKAPKVFKKLVFICFFMIIAFCLFFSGCKKKSCKKPVEPIKEDLVTISFDTDNLDELTKLEVKRDEQVELPKSDVANLCFLGWYFDREFTNQAGDTIKASSDMTLYAKYGCLVKFETSGSAVLDIVYDRESLLSSLPLTYKEGYIFTGWYYDVELTKKVWDSDQILENTVLYAGFSNDTSSTLKRMQKVSDLSVNPRLIIKTKALINSENINDFISLNNAFGESLKLICQKLDDDFYMISSYIDLVPGEMYFYKRHINSLTFESIDDLEVDNVDELSFNIYKEEVEIIEEKETTMVSSENIARLEENVYTYFDDGLEKEVNRIYVRKLENMSFSVGEVISLGDDENSFTAKIVEMRIEHMQYILGDEILYDEFFILDIVNPSVDDLYGEVLVYKVGEVVLEGYVDVTKEEIIENLEQNEAMKKLKKKIVEMLPEVEAINNYKNTLPVNEQAGFLNAITSFSFKRPLVDIRISGTSLKFKITIGGELEIKNFAVSVELEIANETSIEYFFTLTKSNVRTINPLLWFYTNVQLNLTNDFSINLKAEIQIKESGEVEIIKRTDISDEIKNLVDGTKEGFNDFLDSVNKSPLFSEDGTDLDYVDIFNIPIGKIPIPVPVVSLQIDFSVFASIGAKASLSVNFNHHYVETTTLTNGTGVVNNGKYEMYDSFRFSRETTENGISLDITLKGAVGLRIGLEAALSLSFAGLNDIASVFVAFRFGPYIEITGLVNFNYSYDIINKISATTVYGGIYLEVGLFVNAKLGVKFLSFRFDTDLFDTKIKLFDAGVRLIPVEFAEDDNSSTNPYIIRNVYAGISKRRFNMKYLDIVTGEYVIDNASRNSFGTQFYYKISLVDMPDYQTENYQDFIYLTGDETLLISKKYELKSLKFVVKLTLLPVDTMFNTDIERLVYVEYVNPSGRDLVKATFNFYNEYNIDKVNIHKEIIETVETTEGDYVMPPVMTLANLPSRPGYYLDLDDLWERYYAINNERDDSWDKTFHKVTYDNYGIRYYYKLKWKVRDYKLSLFTPVFATASTIKEYVLIDKLTMNYSSYINAFIMKTDDLKISEISGKIFKYYQSSLDLKLKFDYYIVSSTDLSFTDFGIGEGKYLVMHVNKDSALYKSNLDLINGGLEMYAEYDDEFTYTETYVLETGTVKKYKVSYCPFDYKSGTIRPNIPDEVQIGKKFMLNGIEYEITGYLDMNGMGEDIDSYRFYDSSLMPDVTKNRSYYVLFKQANYESLPVYYINAFANNERIASYGVKLGDKISLDLIKINFSDSYLLSRVTNIPYYNLDNFLEPGYQVIWPDNLEIPTNMPNHDINIELKLSFEYKKHQIKFILDKDEYSFVDDLDIDVIDGKRCHVISGRPWITGSADNKYFGLFRLNDYYDDVENKYYVHNGWYSDDGEFYSLNALYAYTKSLNLYPSFVVEPLEFSINLVNYDGLGNEYYEHMLKGDFYGRTLDDILAEFGIDAPTKSDYEGKLTYTFVSYDVDPKTYIIGSLFEDGKIVKTLKFTPIYDAQKTKYSVTFDAIDGSFQNGESKYVVTLPYDEIIDITKIKPNDYNDSYGLHKFLCFTEEIYNLDTKIADEIVVGLKNTTYYAYYDFTPRDVSIKIIGKADTEENDGTGVVYFDNDITKTELILSLKWGQSFYFNASMFKVDSISKDYLPSYVKWEIDGVTYTANFDSDHYMVIIPIETDVTIEIVFEGWKYKTFTATFTSTGSCYDENGTLQDFLVSGKIYGLQDSLVLSGEYSSTITLPKLTFESVEGAKFAYWQAVKKNGEVLKLGAESEVILLEDLEFIPVFTINTKTKNLSNLDNSLIICKSLKRESLGFIQ